MSFSLLYLVLALLGLGVLVFIHELGHYFMAKKVGMKVESFGIGFGKPIYTWEWQGVKWNLCWMPFGGYVKIAGMDSGDEKQDPTEVPGGFFSKSPLDRIKVAFAGPIVNILFAFLLFTLLWAVGGREKNFSEFTPVIGWVDPHSELYKDGVRPGDEVVAYNGRPFESAKDHLYAPLLNPSPVELQGFKVNESGEKNPFEFRVKSYASSLFDQEIKTIGITNPASYVIYNPSANDSIKKVFEGSPMENSGIQPGDRLVWADGQSIFSLIQLNSILNDQHILLTVQHGQEVSLRRVPRFKIGELKLDPEVKEELTDWQHEADLTEDKLINLFAIPYDLSYDAIVDSPLKLIDIDKQQKFLQSPLSPIDALLEKGDKILAVDGVPVQYSYQLFRQIQNHQVLIIVDRGMSWHPVSWKEANENFYRNFPWEKIETIASSIGKNNTVKHANHLFLLNPIVPKKISEFTFSPDKQEMITAERTKQKQAIENISDPEKRMQALKKLEVSENQLMLGLPGIQDLRVIYNPNPIQQFVDVCQEIWHTLVALFSGQLSPKWMAGPIGIVQIVQNSWAVSIREVIFWMGAISLNLGILNLLPIPVLDGGYICLFFIEMITRRRMKPQTLERLMIPFIFLVVGFFIYATYNDIVRLITTFFR